MTEWGKNCNTNTNIYWWWTEAAAWWGTAQSAVTLHYCNTYTNTDANTYWWWSEVAGWWRGDWCCVKCWYSSVTPCYLSSSPGCPQGTDPGGGVDDPCRTAHCLTTLQTGQKKTKMIRKCTQALKHQRSVCMQALKHQNAVCTRALKHQNDVRMQALKHQNFERDKNTCFMMQAWSAQCKNSKATAVLPTPTSVCVCALSSGVQTLVRLAVMGDF